VPDYAIKASEKCACARDEREDLFQDRLLECLKAPLRSCQGVRVRIPPETKQNHHDERTHKRDEGKFGAKVLRYQMRKLGKS